MKDLTHLSLFSGVGGIDLAAEWARFRTILFVETDSYCQKVLRKHWPGVPIIGDIKDVTKERIMAYTQSWQSGEQKARNRGQDIGRGSEEGSLARHTKSNRGEKVRGISEGENSNTRGVCGTDRRPRRSATISPITLITGGFPCQPVSAAGRRRGTEDYRWLWPDMLRVISEVRSTWVVAENVTGLLNMGFNDCVSDLESEGYETIPFLIPACGVNAPHRRDRIFIVAHNESSRLRPQFNKITDKLLSKDRAPQEFESSSRDVADTPSNRSKAGISGQKSGEERESGELINSSETIPDSTGKRLQNWGRSQVEEPGGKNPELNGCDSPLSRLQDDTRSKAFQGWWAVEPELGRVAYGIPNRVDRLKCLGNAVVPQQIYPILKAIAEIEVLR